MRIVRVCDKNRREPDRRLVHEKLDTRPVHYYAHMRTHKCVRYVRDVVCILRCRSHKDPNSIGSPPCNPSRFASCSAHKHTHILFIPVIIIIISFILIFFFSSSSFGAKDANIIRFVCGSAYSVTPSTFRGVVFRCPFSRISL